MEPIRIQHSQIGEIHQQKVQTARQHNVCSGSRTLLPTSDRLLTPKLPQNVVRNKMIQKVKQQQLELTPGDVVRIKPRKHNKEWTKAKVERKVDIRSYNVVTEDGRE